MQEALSRSAPDDVPTLVIPLQSTVVKARKDVCRLAARLGRPEEKDALLFVLANIGRIRDMPADRLGKHLVFRMADFYDALRRAGRVAEKTRSKAAFYRLREPGFSPDPAKPNLRIGFFHTVEIQNGIVDLTVEDYILEKMPVLTKNFRQSIRIDALNVFMLGKAKSKGLYIDLKASIRTQALNVQDVFIPLVYLRQDLGLPPDSYRSVCTIGKGVHPERFRKKDFERLLTNTQREISQKTDLKIVSFSLEKCLDKAYDGSVCYGRIGYRFEVAFQRNGTATEPRSKRTPKAPEELQPRRWGNQYSTAAEREKEEYAGPKDDAGRPIDDPDADDPDEENTYDEGEEADADVEEKKGDSLEIPDNLPLPF